MEMTITNVFLLIKKYHHLFFQVYFFLIRSIHIQGNAPTFGKQAKATLMHRFYLFKTNKPYSIVVLASWIITFIFGWLAYFRFKDIEVSVDKFKQ